MYKWVDLKGVAQEFDKQEKVMTVVGFIADIQKSRVESGKYGICR